MYILRQIRNFFLTILAVGYIVFEEVIWHYVAEPVYLYIQTVIQYDAILNYVATCNRFVILILFLSNFIGSELLGIVSMSFFAQGMFISAIALYVLKFIPVIIAFAILEKSKSKLFTIRWFNYSYHVVINSISYLKHTAVYIHIMSSVIAIRNRKSVSKRLFNYLIRQNK